MLDVALDKAARWLEAGLSVPMAVNISARSPAGQPAFPDRVLAALAAHRIPPAGLILEITETSIMEDPEHALAALQRLHDAGVYLSIDDFGTGYSSLAYLKRLPVDEIKIDRSFVAALTVGRAGPADRGLDGEPRPRAGARCRRRGRRGRGDPCCCSQELGCDLAQGFLFGRPEPDPSLLSRSDEHLRALAEAPPSG